MALATLGTFILWLGWFGFNGASQLAMGTVSDAADVSRIFVNTNLAACGGVMVAAILLNQLIYGKVDLTFALNGALAGLVAITAEPLDPRSPLWAIIIGGIGGIDRRICRPHVGQAENRRCGRCHTGSSVRRYLGNHGRTTNQ